MELYPHNRDAYEKLVAMLEERGRACIVQSTGTGKSFIGIEYVIEHPDERALWLCPSDYIFAEQEGAFEREGLELPGNLARMTSQKLLADFASGAELPSGVDCIILDEFHRAGAPKWEDGVKALLEANSGCKVIGLSATPVRHCDGRDMADEIFDGNIASELGLAEAWLLGILPRPVYVTSLYSIPNVLDALRVSIDGIPEKQIKERILESYEDMRRNLSVAGGLPAVFRKHLKKPDAKVVVFCANLEALNEIHGKASEWFSQVNHDVHAYRVFSANPQGEVEMERFKEDDSDALKVLYCIDQLNEGVHVDGIHAIVMARPTESPIIYLQQLGRCLDSAGALSGKSPVVFDLCNNLGSVGKYVGRFVDEIDEAYRDLQSRGIDPRCTPDDFEVYDEVQPFEVLKARIDEAANAWKNKSYSEMIDFLEANR